MPTQPVRYIVPRGYPERIDGHKEQFQRAWITALAAAAGCIVLTFDVVDDGIDIQLQHKHETHTHPRKTARLELQLKATTSGPDASGDLSVNVRRKRYNEYVSADIHMPVIIAALTMLPTQAHWVYRTSRALSMFGGCYWVSLAGREPVVGNLDKYKSVKIPTSQPLDDVVLAQIMERIGRGGMP